ncbi:MAG: FAD-dependent oxidoreductase [Mollicutes bacterium]|nr:FAD-dependent oxidoreductase [Mollicutes bacterium]
MYDVIIIGMGMAGITAGIYAKRAGLNVLMFEKNAPGGQLQKIDTIKNYPGYVTVSGPDLSMHLFNQINELKVDFKIEEVTKIDVEDEVKKVYTASGEYTCKNIIIAVGRIPKYLGLDNEKDYLGKGVSTCATCDGALYNNEDVAVVGSGNSALSESLYLSKIAKTVYLLHRGVEFKGEDELVTKIKDTPNIKIISGVSVKKINETDGKISSVLLSNENTINIKGIFIYVGYRPDTEIFKDLEITNIEGNIITDERFETKYDNVYAIGDCIQKGVYQLVTAAAEGAIAVSELEKNN